MAAVPLHYAHYNFCRPHQTLTKNAKGYATTPAMAAGIAGRVWTIADFLGLMTPDGQSEG